MTTQDLIYKQQSEFLGVKISKDEKELIKKYAKKHNLNQTKVVRIALRDFFLKNEEVKKGNTK